MRKIGLIILLLALSIIAAGCNKERVIVDNGGTANTEDNTNSKSELLAGSQSKYYTFTQEAYDKALAENKIIMLYFYANWCPICKVEQPSTKAAFNELSNPDIIGFRVNYKDSDTDSYEEELAKQYGISYQHTKVIIKDGERVLKAPDSWDKARYIEELSKVA